MSSGTDIWGIWRLATKTNATYHTIMSLPNGVSLTASIVNPVSIPFL
jgi:hypothetical protein